MTKHSIYKTLYILFFSSLFLVTSIDNLQAQRRRHSRDQIIKAYPSIGITSSQIRGDELKGFKKWGFTAGVGALVNLTDNEMWQMSLEADFSERGAFNNTGDPYSLINFTLHYVDIPLTFHFTDPWGGLKIGAGLVYSRLVQQPHGSIRYSPSYFVPDTSDMSFLHNDLCAAIDLRFPIWKGLTFNIRYQHSLFPVKRDWWFTEHLSAVEGDVSRWSNNCYNSSVMVRLQYVFGEDSGHKKNNSSSRSHKTKKRR
ncbi:MAG: hypothetical protein J6Y98_01260 [Bacteroidales bacterium]|nr:hypothetical protein [Bacteroidales bacterium]